MTTTKTIHKHLIEVPIGTEYLYEGSIPIEVFIRNNEYFIIVEEPETKGKQKLFDCQVHFLNETIFKAYTFLNKVSHNEYAYWRWIG